MRKILNYVCDLYYIGLAILFFVKKIFRATPMEEVPRLGVETELQLLAYTTAMVM